MNRRQLACRLAVCAAPLAVLLAACSASPTTSTISGSISQASFPSPVTKLTVVAADGRTSTVAVTAAGRFKVELAPGQSYRLFAGPDGASIPVVVSSATSAFGAAIDVKSAGATVNLGDIRYSAGARSATPYEAHFVPTSAMTSSVVANVPATPGTCVAGALSTTGLPCATQSAAISCSESDDEECDGDHHHHHDHGDDGADCENGVDVQGNACDGGPAANADDGANDGEAADDAGQDGETADDVDTTQAFAVTSFNLDGAIQCKEHDDEDHGDEDHGDDGGDD